MSDCQARRAVKGAVLTGFSKGRRQPLAIVSTANLVLSRLAGGTPAPHFRLENARHGGKLAGC